jgi:hypothetical protein
MRRALLLLALVSWLMPLAVLAVDADIHVSYDGARLEFRFDALIRAPAESVQAVLREYDRLDRVFPLVARSQPLASPQAGVDRVSTLMRGCILFLCRELPHTVDIRYIPGNWSSAITVPELSRMRKGHISWRVDPETSDGDHARMQMYGYLEPDVQVPRLLGPPLVRAWVRSEFIENIGRIERAALARSDADAAVTR